MNQLNISVEKIISVLEVKWVYRASQEEWEIARNAIFGLFPQEVVDNVIIPALEQRVYTKK